MNSRRPDGEPMGKREFVGVKQPPRELRGGGGAHDGGGRPGGRRQGGAVGEGDDAPVRAGSGAQESGEDAVGGAVDARGLGVPQPEESGQQDVVGDVAGDGPLGGESPGRAAPVVPRVPAAAAVRQAGVVPARQSVRLAHPGDQRSV